MHFLLSKLKKYLLKTKLDITFFQPVSGDELWDGLLDGHGSLAAAAAAAASGDQLKGDDDDDGDSHGGLPLASDGDVSKEMDFSLPLRSFSLLLNAFRSSPLLLYSVGRLSLGRWLCDAIWRIPRSARGERERRETLFSLSLLGCRCRDSSDMSRH